MVRAEARCGDPTSNRRFDSTDAAEAETPEHFDRQFVSIVLDEQITHTFAFALQADDYFTSIL